MWLLSQGAWVKVVAPEAFASDITHKATPQQLTEATVQQWKKGGPNSPKIQKLIDEGYLQKDANGNITVPKSVQKALEHNIRHSQNVENKIILQNTNYGEVAKDAAKHTKAAVGKIIAGQIIYYAAPPLVYEVRMILNNRQTKLDSALSQLGNAAQRIGEYVFSLFGVTIKSCVIEVLFELAADTLHIPEPFDDIIFGPLQILTTVVCTNLTMLILQKADLFDVRFGFKINAIKNIFAKEYEAYAQEMAIAEDMAELQR